MSVTKIETAITQLNRAELTQFRQWFWEFDNNVWDAQIEADANAGKLDALAAEALVDAA